MTPEAHVREMVGRQRSAPVIENPDGTATWNDRQFPNKEEAYEARRFYRAATFSTIYGGYDS